MPDPILVGRNADKIASAWRKRTASTRWTTDLDAALANPNDTIFFDAGTTQMRPDAADQGDRRRQARLLREADRDRSRRRARRLRARQDRPASSTAWCRTSCSCPACSSSKLLRDSGFFGRMLSVRGEFGYWVFEGDWQPAQRPSWNYRSEDGGGIILDMLCHWRYVLDNLFGEVEGVSCLGATHIPERCDEKGKPYKATADDAAYATFELEGGVIAQINTTWVTRVRRDDLVTFQVDGTHGSAVAGLHRLRDPGRVNTPQPVWNPDEPQHASISTPTGRRCRTTASTTTASRCSGRCSSATSCEDAPFRCTLLEGAKGVQLAECALQSWRERRWIDVPR